MSFVRKYVGWRTVAGLLGVVIAVLLGRPLLGRIWEKPPPPLPQIKVPPSPREIANPHLDRAEKASELAIDQHLKTIDAFFAESKKNTRAFADEALSFRSKVLLASDSLPMAAQQYNAVKDRWWFQLFLPPGPLSKPLIDMAGQGAAKLKDDRHKVFIREKFEGYIFKPPQLEEAVKQVISSYLAHIRSLEGRMLVDLRADVADIPSAHVLAQIDANKLQATYDQALAAAIKATGSSLQAGVATELVTIITGEVLTQVAVRLGVSAGILGTGAATGWATFGIGVVVGLIVDQIVSWVWDWWADPKGNLGADLDKKLDDINHLIVDGSENVQGLRARLRQFARDRDVVRRQAVLSLLISPDGGTK